MCCRACAGYELCRTKGKLAEDDCCSRCPYFDSCMMDTEEEKTKPRRSPSPRTTKM